MKVVHIYPMSCEYAYPQYLDPSLDPDEFDQKIMCNTDLEVRYLKGLYELGVECVLFYPRRFNLPVKSFTHRGGYKITRFPITFFEGQEAKELPLKMFGQLKKEKPDLVHFHGIFGGKYYWPKLFDLMAMFCKLNKIPFFGWYHVGTFPKGKRFPILWYPMRKIKAAAIKSCSGITSINKNALKRLFDPNDSEYYGIDFSTVPYMQTPNTFDRKMFYPVSRKEALNETGLDEKKIYILMVSRLYYEKGLHYIINSLPTLKNKYPNVQLLVIGEFLEGTEKYQYEIKQKIETLDLKDNVTFLGRIEHQLGLLYYYNVADVFVLPTYMDSFAAVNIEAMACGTPVISTDREEIPYYLKPCAGILIPPCDERSVLNAIEKVLSGNFIADEKERDQILSKYDYLTAAENLKKWYEEILSV